jgi:hypothetical protein
MAKISMTCPFSNKACVECAVYRGRHLYLCFEKGHRRCEWDFSVHSSTGLRKVHGNEDETSRSRTDIPTRPMLISNVEDLIEEEEFLRFEEKRRKA